MFFKRKSRIDAIFVATNLVILNTNRLGIITNKFELEIRVFKRLSLV